MATTRLSSSGGDSSPHDTPGVPSPSKPRLHAAVPRAVDPQPVATGAELDHPALYFNRELSWLDFNWRVLHLALDERTPLLERVRFAAITTSNMDEFFRKRVGGLKRQAAAGVVTLSPDGRTPLEQLRLAQHAVRPMHDALCDVWVNTLKPALADQAGIRILDYDGLAETEHAFLREYFQKNIFPVLTPLAVDPGHPFPFISNLSLSLAVTLRHPTRGTEHFARLKVPTSRGRFVRLPGDGHSYVPVEQVIAANVGEVFRGMDVVGAHTFRLTRNADIRRDEEEADDLIEMIAEELRERRFAPVTRLELASSASEDVRALLTRELQLSPEDIFDVDGELDLTDLHNIASIDIPALQFRPWDPVIPSRLRHAGEAKDRVDMFSVIRGGDIMVHHPYEAFSASVLRFIEDAAVDPKVVAIKQTLYRTSDDSRVVNALIRAAERGKQVAVLVEVKARFDEANNMEWGALLERAGVHVTYGLVGLKTHTKTTLVIREEEDGLRAYCHIGTGNYHQKTAKLYTDIGYFTCDPDVGYDIINLFHYLTGYAPEQHYKKLVVAPRDMRRTFVQLVRREVELHEKHGDGRIVAKMNALDDTVMIQELYRASQAGVRIDLIVRGHCRLRPGLPGISDNIRLVSILGRFLEHSRIFWFRNNEEHQVFIGSADWQRRNLDDRVEAVLEIDDESARQRLIDTLELALLDNRSAWELGSDGQYQLRMPADGLEEPGFQEQLMHIHRQDATESSSWDIT
ncbi:MAG: polyphosphate kinase 1 [Rhodothermales bacterium]|nr:polyphosphate kinase 1 [Rhodothermales bacterium]MBO6780423.1 polyphosphate kinase 1 [Rhodothermales bacterium]